METAVFLIVGAAAGSAITLLVQWFFYPDRLKDRLHIYSFSKESESEVILTVGVASDNLRSLKKLKSLLPGNGWISASEFVGNLKSNQFFMLRIRDDFQTTSEWMTFR